MKRRDFIKSVIAGSTVAWPVTAWAQQPTVIGFLRSTKAEESGQLVAGVREGLRDSGYPGDKVLIESRWGTAETNNCRNSNRVSLGERPKRTTAEISA